MEKFVDIKSFPNMPVITNKEGILEELTEQINNDLNNWTKVKVEVNGEFIDELHAIITYEWRYRLYLSDLYKMLGYDDIICEINSCYYWEKDLDGNDIGHCLP